MTAPLTALLERVEAATEGSREIDWLVADYLGEVPEHTVREIGWDYVWWRRPDEFALWKANDSEGRDVSLWQAQQVSTSLDAALALVERVLPGWLVEMRIYRSGPKPVAFLCEPDKDDAGILDPWPERHSSNGATPPLAILAALLRALIALASRDAAGPADAEGV